MISLLMFLLGTLYGAGAARAFFVSRALCDFGVFASLIVAVLWPLFLLLCLFAAVVVGSLGEISLRRGNK